MSIVTYREAIREKYIAETRKGTAWRLFSLDELPIKYQDSDII